MLKEEKQLVTERKEEFELSLYLIILRKSQFTRTKKTFF